MFFIRVLVVLVGLFVSSTFAVEETANPRFLRQNEIATEAQLEGAQSFFEYYTYAGSKCKGFIGQAIVAPLDKCLNDGTTYWKYSVSTKKGQNTVLRQVYSDSKCKKATGAVTSVVSASTKCTTDGPISSIVSIDICFRIILTCLD